LFYTNPNRSFYVREITRKIDEQINSVRRELSNLLSIGIIKSDESGNRLYYEVNQEYQHYKPLKSMFSNLSSKRERAVAEAGGNMSEKVRALGQVELAVLTGFFVRNPNLPVDFLVIGDVNKHALEKLVEDMEKDEGQVIRYAVISKADFDYRRDLNDRFINSILENKHTLLVGELPEQAKKKSKK
jgi:DNA-binding transcriptional ArsR family regulator